MEKLQRTQVLLEPTQHETLYRLAQAEGRSMSELVREAVAQYLVERSDTVRADQEIDALERLIEFRKAIEARHGVYPGDIVTEVRAERDEEIEQLMRANSQ
jgi:metal-responsive CopG/Arc/MetJ family transcriptional regulator